jgi:ankyrin repeat protein
MGNTALHVVSQAKQDDPDFDASVATIELLLKYGADARALNNEGRTPAQWYRQLLWTTWPTTWRTALTPADTSRRTRKSAWRL